MPIIPYGCETWSFTLSKERKLRIFNKNNILRRVFESKRDENGEWRGIRNEDFHGLYISLNIVNMVKSARLEWTGSIAKMEI